MDVEAMRLIPLYGKRGSLHTRTWVMLALVVVAVACTMQDDVPTQERRAYKLNKTIMCPICPGESIDQAQNTLAVQMRGIVSEKLEQGWNDDQIKAFFVERYGPSVLLEPPRQGFSLMAWIIPPVGVVVAGLAFFLSIRLMRRSPPPQAEGIGNSVQLTNDEFAKYHRRIEAALADKKSKG